MVNLCKRIAKFIFMAVASLGLLMSGCHKSNTWTFQGYIEGKYSYIAPAISGKLDFLPVQRGTQVKADQLLFKLDQEPEASNLKAAQQNLIRDKKILDDIKLGQRETIIRAIEAQKSQVAANLDLANITLQRYKTLYKTHTIDKASLDQATANQKNLTERLQEIEENLKEAQLGGRANIIAAQQAIVESGKANLAHAEWALNQKTVYAPYAGIIFDTLSQEGEFIAAGQPVVILLPRELIKIIFFVPQQYLSQMHLGMPITFGCDKCTKLYKGVISFISPEAEYTPPVIFSKETRNKLIYRIEASIDAEDLYKVNVGQPVDVFVEKNHI